MRMTMCRKMIASILIIAICCGSIPVIASSDLGMVEDTIIGSSVATKQKISDELLEKMDEVAASDSKDEKIPVCIWYEDIDDEAVTAEVEKQTGLTIHDLDTSLAMPSDEILNEIATMSLESTDTVSAGCTEEMTAYLNETKAARAYERKITDEYIGAKRDVSKDMIGEKYEEVFADYEMNDSDIIFKSQYAPMVIVELTKCDFEELTQNEKIVSFDLFADINENQNPPEESGWNTIANCLEINGFSKMKETTGLTGSGVTLGMVDHDTPFEYSGSDMDKTKIEVLESGVDIHYNPESTEEPHSVNSARIIMGTTGVAPNIKKLYSVTHLDKNFDEDATDNKFDGFKGYYCAIELLVKKGVTIINASINLDGVRSGESYSQCERWTDYITNTYGLTIMQSAGNGRNKDDEAQWPVWMPGAAYNVITVGAMEDSKTEEHNDDYVFEYSSYDTQGGCAKPDVLAPARLGGGGTSSAAPVVTGLVALMLELKPSLSAHPQIIKAILLASCHRKVLDPITGTQKETMEQGLTEKQGAGVIDPYIAICIVGNKQYGIREVGTSGESIDIVQPKYNSSNINVSIAWFHEGVHVTGDDEFSPESIWHTSVHNLSLSLVQNHMMLLGHTDEENSSTEMIYTPMYSSINKYTIDIDGDSAKTTPVTCAYAWSTDKMYFQQPSKQGIYRLKNLNSKLYLDVNTNGNLLQKNYEDSITQEWAIVKSTESTAASDLYTLTTDGYTGYAGEGDSVSTHYVYANMLQTQSSMGVLEYNEYICLYKELGDSSALACLQPINGAEATGTRMGWHAVTGEDSQKWLLEKVNYCKGDIDKDGVLEAEDANAIQQYVVKAVAFTEIQKYLADVNDDGEVTAMDANKTLNRVVGLE